MFVNSVETRKANEPRKSRKDVIALNRLVGMDETRGDTEDIRLSVRPKRCGIESFRVSNYSMPSQLCSTPKRGNKEEMFFSQRRDKKSVSIPKTSTTSKLPNEIKLSRNYPMDDRAQPDEIEMSRTASIEERDQAMDGFESVPSIDEIMINRSSVQSSDDEVSNISGSAAEVLKNPIEVPDEIIDEVLDEIAAEISDGVHNQERDRAPSTDHQPTDHQPIDHPSTDCTKASEKVAGDGIFIPRGSYWVKVMSVVKIQSMARVFLTRMKLKSIDNKVLDIQRVYRSYAARKKIEHDIQNIVVLQSLYRRKIAAQKIKKIKRSIIQDHIHRRAHYTKATKIQKFVLGVIWKRKRKEMLKEREYALYVSKYALILQAFYRGFLVRKELEKDRMSATSIQRTYRSYLLRNKLKGSAEKVTVIQRICRGYLLRKNVEAQRELDLQNRSATAVQRIARAHIQYRKFGALVVSAVACQRICRGYLQRKELKVQNSSAMAIQRIYRGNVHRQNVAAYREQKELDEQTLSATIIQRIFRGYLQLQRYQDYLQQKDQEKQSLSATTVQRIYRGHLRFRKFKALVQSTVKCQGICRGYLQRKELEVQTLSASAIQQIYRRHHCFRKFQAIILSSITVQRVYRGYRGRILCKVKRKQYTQAVTLIQLAFRAYVFQKRLNMWKSRATVIQRAQRKFAARSSYEKRLKNTILIQSVIRMCLLQNKITMMHLNAQTIQRVYRGKFCRIEVQKKDRGAVVIQSTARGFLGRCKRDVMLKNIVLVQSAVRIFIAKRKTKQLSQLREEKTAVEAYASSQIQARWRCYREKWNYLYFLADVITIQSLVRRWKACKYVKQRREQEGLATKTEAKQSVRTLAKMLDSFVFDRSFVRKNFKIKSTNPVEVQDSTECTHDEGHKDDADEEESDPCKVGEGNGHEKDEGMKPRWLQPACVPDGEESMGSGSKTSKTSKSTQGGSSLHLLQAMEFNSNSLNSSSVNSPATVKAVYDENFMTPSCPESYSTLETNYSEECFKLHLFQHVNSHDEADIEICLDDTVEQNRFSLWGRKALELPPTTG